MALQPVAVLGLDGWVNTPKEKLDNLFVHFVEANHSQTTLSRGHAYSFQYLIATNREAFSTLCEQMQSTLKEYFGGYYTSVDASVTVVNDPQKGDAVILQIYLTVKDEYGAEYNLARISSDIKLKTVKWSNLNNFGDENIYNQ